MLTTRVRFGLIAVAVFLLGWTYYERHYEVSAFVGLAIAFLVQGYFKEGTVVLAAKAYHHQDYDKTEALLKEIKNPDRLKRSRRGYYEFMYGNIELKRENLIEAERHFQIASRFPLKNENEKGLVLTQLANINLGKREFKKAQAYIDIAKELKISARVKSIIENIEQEIHKGSE